MRLFQNLPILLFLFALQSPVLGQQVPFLNHYSWNPRLFNPANQGADGNGEITAVYRSQFQSIEAADRPNTYLFHADFSPWMPERIGLAAQVTGDKTHLFSRFQFSGFFGYHLLRNEQIRLSLGAAASFYSQNIDFDGRRLSDVLDLAIFQNQVSSNRFDGGPGLMFEYRTESGSFFAVDMAATQLFSSDIPINGPASSSRKGAVYDIVPHFLANARVRIQGNGFAIEPCAAYRALGGDRPLKAGVFDFNLNSYFLNNNRLMVGAGIRSNQGGLHFQLGIMPTTAIRLLASAELHAALGPSYEFGASYTFGKSSTPAPIEPVEPEYEGVDILEGASKEIEVMTTDLASDFAALDREQESALAAISAKQPTNNRQQQAIAADSCSAQLAESGRQLEQLRQRAQSIDVRRLQAEQVVRNATNQGGIITGATQRTLKLIQDRSAVIQSALQEAMTVQQNLIRQCNALRPETNVATCIQNGDSECIQEIFLTALQNEPSQPANLYPLRIFAVPGAAAITYQFPNDEEVYSLSNEQKALARHLVQQVRTLESKGVALDKLALVSELQEDRSTLGYRLGLEYNSEAGNTQIAYTLVNNATGETENQSLFIAPGSRISLEALAALKLEAWQKALVEQGLPAKAISLEIRYNHTANIYREETKLVLRLRK